MEGNAHTKADLVKPLLASPNNKIFLSVLGVSIILGTATGYILSQKGGTSNLQTSGNGQPTTAGITVPQQDASTFKDFAEGTIRNRPPSSDPNADYTEGAYLLERTGAQPVALTSSVVDLSPYVGKKVKVYGETQKALKEGWLMDVGRVDVE